MPIVRRRPLMRMAAVGGVAYMGSKAGTKRAMQQGAAGQSPTGAQQQAAQPAAAAPTAPTAQPAPAGPEGAGDRIAQLQQLAQLHESGALSDEEFAQAKAQVLA
ncbi:MAG: SHOCT domain-containing protein [Acidimicrobiales bacterium]